MEVSLCLFLIRFHGSDKDGAEVGGRPSCGRRFGHSDKVVAAMNSEEMLGDEREIASTSMQMGESPESKSPPRLAGT